MDNNEDNTVETHIRSRHTSDETINLWIEYNQGVKPDVALGHNINTKHSVPITDVY